MNSHDHTHCYNCNTELLEGANHCAKCGQRVTTGHITIWTLFKEFLSDYLHLDSKFPATIVPLFLKPGYLTNEYFAGKHKSYLRPLRLFGVSTVLFFAFILFQFVDKSEVNNQLEGLHQKFALDVERKAIYKEIDSILLELKEQIPSQRTRNLIDTAFQDYKYQAPSSSDTLEFNTIDIGTTQFKHEVAKSDLVSKTPEELVALYEIEGFWEQLLFSQNIKVLQHGGNFFHFIVQRFTWLFFFMMPVFALILKLLYIRRNRFYVEHLIFAFHFHAFGFLYALLFLLFVNFLPEWVYGILSIYIFVYLYIAIRKVYQQNHFKTFVKYSTLLFAYLFLFIFGLVCTIIVSFVLY